MTGEHGCNFEELTKEEFISYDTSRYDFRSKIQKIFDWKDLSTLHEKIPGSTKPGLVSFENDQATPFHKQYYGSSLLPDFLDLYETFIREFIAPMFVGEQRIIFQKRPSFRIHLPNNVAVGKKHRDFDYNHPEGEINFWLPFTSVNGTNGLFVETEPEKGDYHSVVMDYGQIFRFYGNKCWHYNECNITDTTRVSVDFRVIPGSKWDDNTATGTSVKSGMKFIIGGYYDVYEMNIK